MILNAIVVYVYRIFNYIFGYLHIRIVRLLYPLDVRIRISRFISNVSNIIGVVGHLTKFQNVSDKT